MCIWNAWWKERITSNEIQDDVASEAVMPLLQMNKELMQHWLTVFILEVRKQNGTEYPPNTLHHIVCSITRCKQASIQGYLLTNNGTNWSL